MSLYRVGESYWNEAPGDIDREQEYTKRAMKEWNLLLSRYPGGKYAKEAKAKVKIGKSELLQTKFSLVVSIVSKKFITRALIDS